MTENSPKPNNNQPKDINERTPPPQVAPRRIAIQMTKNKPIATYVILAITVAIYFFQMGTQYLFNVDIPAAYGMKVNEMIARGQFWRLLTPIFLHGSILHIGFNMYALYLFGPSLERYYGKSRFIVLYFLSGFAGNVFSMMFSTSPSLGSSTAIFGLLGAQGVFIHQNRDILGERSSGALKSIISVAVINLLIGLSPGIDNWGHVGGLLGGTLFAWFAGPLLTLEGIYPQIKLGDRRDHGEIFRALIVVSAFFVILTIGTLFIWSK
ncbi:MAG TPA: rhomboid family intramembrane serine protease [Anaerolineae bacterium]|nr:rhomboid family intramembrane serine protease [Anaerolineae bacterium]